MPNLFFSEEGIVSWKEEEEEEEERKLDILILCLGKKGGGGKGNRWGALITTYAPRWRRYSSSAFPG